MVLGLRACVLVACVQACVGAAGGSPAGYAEHGQGYWSGGHTSQDSTSSIAACAKICTGLRGCTAFVRVQEGGHCYTYTERKASSARAWKPTDGHDAFLRDTPASTTRADLARGNVDFTSTSTSTTTMATAMLTTRATSTEAPSTTTTHAPSTASAAEVAETSTEAPSTAAATATAAAATSAATATTITATTTTAATTATVATTATAAATTARAVPSVSRTTTTAAMLAAVTTVAPSTTAPATAATVSLTASGTGATAGTLKSTATALAGAAPTIPSSSLTEASTAATVVSAPAPGSGAAHQEETTAGPPRTPATTAAAAIETTVKPAATAAPVAAIESMAKPAATAAPVATTMPAQATTSSTKATTPATTKAPRPTRPAAAAERAGGTLPTTTTTTTPTTTARTSGGGVLFEHVVKVLVAVAGCSELRVEQKVAIAAAVMRAVLERSRGRVEPSDVVATAGDCVGAGADMARRRRQEEGSLLQVSLAFANNTDAGNLDAMIADVSKSVQANFTVTYAFNGTEHSVGIRDLVAWEASAVALTTAVAGSGSDDHDDSENEVSTSDADSSGSMGLVVAFVVLGLVLAVAALAGVSLWKKSHHASARVGVTADEVSAHDVDNVPAIHQGFFAAIQTDDDNNTNAGGFDLNLSATNAPPLLALPAPQLPSATRIPPIGTGTQATRGATQTPKVLRDGWQHSQQTESSDQHRLPAF